ncbi:hypothetical protein HPP92_004160 [Vanilla planifolia]|uniref:TCP domain-containing protein n=1 Tax=Vanilla planifolia TaxID=51239 RepID=A0A835S1A3_VANPL|nr:hypothetical protein HPP92_004160 [Vanilla planifolia]
MEAEGIHSSKRTRNDKDEEAAVLKDVSGLRSWQNASSRIIRVSRVSGGKDRHSKVWTAKGLRDRRVRLSVSTAIQFYDLQDRLGYDQPSKAVDWLINAASAAIADLPELDGTFPLQPPVALSSYVKVPEIGASGERKQLSRSNSSCSSVSETSKGSVLCLTRCDGQGQTRKEDHKIPPQQPNMNMRSSFTELLTTGGIGDGGVTTLAVKVADCSSGFCPKPLRPLLTNSTADFLTQAGIYGQTHKNQQLASAYSSLLHFGNNPHMGMGVMAYNAATIDHQEMQQFSFMQDHVIPVATIVPGGDYDLNVSISSGFAGFNRGTLQSNSTHHHQPAEGTNLPIFGAAVPFEAPGPSSENQPCGGFNGRFQLCYNDAHRQHEPKGEQKG